MDHIADIAVVAFVVFACLYDGKGALGESLPRLPFRFSNRKNGGIRFVRIGRLFFSFGVSVRR